MTHIPGPIPGPTPDMPRDWDGALLGATAAPVCNSCQMIHESMPLPDGRYSLSSDHQPGCVVARALEVLGEPVTGGRWVMEDDWTEPRRPGGPRAE